MRLWSVHPKFLDSKGLVALWREALLAQAVLLNQTKGYKNHPQLDRFKGKKNPVGAMGCYLISVWDEASSRGYSFNREKIHKPARRTNITVTEGQFNYEIEHLIKKLKVRDTEKLKFLSRTKPTTHPMFEIVPGNIESWEIITEP